MKCMDSCFCFLSLKLGAYLISFVFILTSITISITLGYMLQKHVNIHTPTQQGLFGVLLVAHILLFFSTCFLLYGLCMGKMWPLLTFIPATAIIALNEVAIVLYIIINRHTLPDDTMAFAAAQSFILIAVIFSALEVYSLYEQWQEDTAEGRNLTDVLEFD